jgi:(p)ppGpp synthase/HD superfamily hydrolase
MNETSEPALPEFGEKLGRALRFACALHAKQLRKGTAIPYVGHLLGVCSIVLDHGGNEDEAVAAVLHDSIEDQAEAFGGAEKLRKHIADFTRCLLAIREIAWTSRSGA